MDFHDLRNAGFATMGLREVAREVGPMSSLMLMCAVVASLAVGVFAAQAVCVAIFRVFRMTVRAAVAPVAAARVDLGPVQG
jgi:hypothetical protein